MIAKPKKAIEKGPIAERVQANIRKWREARGLTQIELAERMDDLGRHIHITALSRIESGERRVDCDDLVAFALALDVTPNVLLLGDDPVELAPTVWATEREAWRWATGESPLAGTAISRERFRRECRPHIREAFSLATIGRHWSQIDTAVTAMENLNSIGVAPEEILGILTARLAERADS